MIDQIIMKYLKFKYNFSYKLEKDKDSSKRDRKLWFKHGKNIFMKGKKLIRPNNCKFR
jgi:hypothetical protein